MGISVYPSISEVQGNYYGSYTFATKPTASNYPSGSVIRITDVGVSGNAGSIWVTDGTYWSPENGHIVLASSAVAQSHTGNTDETALASLSIPAGLIGPNGTLVISGKFSHPISSNVKTMRVNLASTTLCQVAASASNGTLAFEWRISNRNSESSQLGHFTGNTGVGGSAASFNTGTVDTSQAQTLAITAQLSSGAETITLEGYSIELLRR